jgi:hypothetical protein
MDGTESQEASNSHLVSNPVDSNAHFGVNPNAAAEDPIGIRSEATRDMARQRADTLFAICVLRAGWTRGLFQ